MVLYEKRIRLMESLHSVEFQIAKVKNVFQQALSISSEDDDLVIDEHLKNVEPEFRAVAYEGIAMGLVSNYLEEGTLQRWRTFMRNSDAAYLPHLHVGLGWAIAKRKLPSLFFLDTLNPMMLYRVIDGCGCYDGMFKQVQTIHNKVRPDCIEEKYFDAYDEGVGRSLWTVCNGNVEKISEIILGYPASRHQDLWRGVSIACSFVGGCNEATLRSLLALSGDHRLQLALGATIVAGSRIQTNTFTEHSELTWSVFCNLSSDEVMKIAREPVYAIVPYDAYKQWLNIMESRLVVVWNDQLSIVL